MNYLVNKYCYVFETKIGCPDFNDFRNSHDIEIGLIIVFSITNCGHSTLEWRQSELERGEKHTLVWFWPPWGNVHIMQE